VRVACYNVRLHQALTMHAWDLLRCIVARSGTIILYMPSYIYIWAITMGGKVDVVNNFGYQICLHYWRTHRDWSRWPDGDTLPSDASGPAVQLLDAALSSLTQATILSGWVKCVATTNSGWLLVKIWYVNYYHQVWFCPCGCWGKTCGWQVTLPDHYHDHT